MHRNFSIVTKHTIQETLTRTKFVSIVEKLLFCCQHQPFRHRPLLIHLLVAKQNGRTQKTVCLVYGAMNMEVRSNNENAAGGPNPVQANLPIEAHQPEAAANEDEYNLLSKRDQSEF